MTHVRSHKQLGHVSTDKHVGKSTKRAVTSTLFGRIFAYTHLGKAFALIASIIILSTAALTFLAPGHAGQNNGAGNKNANHQQPAVHGQHQQPRISMVPEANAGTVLIPFVGAVLLFSSLQLFRAKAAQKSSALP
jgi:hypothetical protein